MTLITTSLLLPFVSVTPLWALAWTSGERPTLSPAFLVRRQTDAFPAELSVPVAAVEIAWILRGAIRSRMIGVVAVTSPAPDFIRDVVRDLRVTEDRSRCNKERVGLDEG